MEFFHRISDGMGASELKKFCRVGANCVMEAPLNEKNFGESHFELKALQPQHTKELWETVPRFVEKFYPPNTFENFWCQNCWLLSPPKKFQ